MAEPADDIRAALQLAQLRYEVMKMADWKERLKQKLTRAEETKHVEATGIAKAEEDARSFYTTIAGPALEEIKVELEKHGRTVNLHTSEHDASMSVRYQDQEEIWYSIKTGIYPNYVRAYPQYRMYAISGRAFTLQGYFRSGSQDYHALSLTKDEIINNFMSHYQPRIKTNQ